jgi:hypothetical protein
MCLNIKLDWFCKLIGEKSLRACHREYTFVIKMTFLMEELNKQDRWLIYLGAKIEYCEEIQRKEGELIWGSNLRITYKNKNILTKLLKLKKFKDGKMNGLTSCCHSYFLTYMTLKCCSFVQLQGCYMSLHDIGSGYLASPRANHSRERERGGEVYKEGEGVVFWYLNLKMHI